MRGGHVWSRFSTIIAQKNRLGIRRENRVDFPILTSPIGRFSILSEEATCRPEATCFGELLLGEPGEWYHPICHQAIEAGRWLAQWRRKPADGLQINNMVMKLSQLFYFFQLSPAFFSTKCRKLFPTYIDMRIVNGSYVKRLFQMSDDQYTC
jgi:hypothetical protein